MRSGRSTCSRWRCSGGISGPPCHSSLRRSGPWGRSRHGCCSAPAPPSPTGSSRLAAISPTSTARPTGSGRAGATLGTGGDSTACARPLLGPFRTSDVRAAQRPHLMLTNSQHSARKIHAIYGRNAEVLATAGPVPAGRRRSRATSFSSWPACSPTRTSISWCGRPSAWGPLGGRRRGAGARPARRVGRAGDRVPIPCSGGRVGRAVRPLPGGGGGWRGGPRPGTDRGQLGRPAHRLPGAGRCPGDRHSRRDRGAVPGTAAWSRSSRRWPRRRRGPGTLPGSSATPGPGPRRSSPTGCGYWSTPSPTGADVAAVPGLGPRPLEALLEMRKLSERSDQRPTGVNKRT